MKINVFRGCQSLKCVHFPDASSARRWKTPKDSDLCFFQYILGHLSTFHNASRPLETFPFMDASHFAANVTMPGTVTSIGHRALAGCIRMAHLEFGGGRAGVDR